MTSRVSLMPEPPANVISVSGRRYFLKPEIDFVYATADLFAFADGAYRISCFWPTAVAWRADGSLQGIGKEKSSCNALIFYRKICAVGLMDRPETTTFASM